MRSKLLALFILFCLTMSAQENEGISWKEASINDKIKLSLSLAEFENRYKKADSIIDGYAYSCAEKSEVEVKLYYYKGICFELQKDNTLKFSSIDFSVRKAMYFSINDDWFDHTTSLKSFHRSFPEQAEYVEDIYDDLTGEEYQSVVIFPRDLSESYEWNFNFKNGKLHSITYIESCK